jgi:large subunit ribosomal protein L1
MPNPRTGTVVQPGDISGAIEQARQGRVELRMDKTAIIHTAIGKVSFEDAALVENLTTVVTTLLRAKPAEVKGQLIKKATITTTMGPGIQLDLSELESQPV